MSLDDEATVPEALFSYFMERCSAVSTHRIHRITAEKGWPPTANDQIAWIHSEVSEVFQALKKNEGSPRTLEEICDIVLSAIALANLLGFSDATFMDMMELTLQKVEHREELR
jgi:NTP pyrophosphatase (non-canonical NTP hydrolase)